jgi:hypothetical protein
MKNLSIVLLLLICLAATSFAGDWKPIRSQQAVAATVELVSSDISTSVIHFKLDGFYLNEVKTSRGNAYTVSVGNSTPILD